MINSKAFLGYPINFKGKFLIYSPKVKDMVEDDNFFLYVDLLTRSQEEVEDILVEGKADLSFIPTPIEFLLSSAYHNKMVEDAVKSAFRLFLHTDVTLLYEAKSILLGNLEKMLKQQIPINNYTFLTEDDFFDFQNTLREILGYKPVEPPNINEHPKVKAMKAKARYRDKVKAKQAKGISFATSLVAICCMNIGISPLNIGELSYASIGYLTNMYQNKEEYLINMNYIYAGADPKKIKPQYWIRNLE